MTLLSKIPRVDQGLKEALLQKINQKTKPLGSLGILESVALQVGLIQGTLDPALKEPHIIVFAADHGIAREGVSAFPREVTYQMVLNFLSGGAAINVFCKQNNIGLSIVDAGVDADFESQAALLDHKIARGTQNLLKGPAMTVEQCEQALQTGGQLVEELQEKQTNIVGFGEMGIGNTSSASLLMSRYCDLPLKDCVGKGTGLTQEQLQHKIKVLQEALSSNAVQNTDPIQVLATFGGFEIAMMTGAMLAAARLKMVILVDGFIATAACLAAFKIDPGVLDYAIFSHESAEQGHKKMLRYLGVRGLLQLDLRLGEGSGCAVAYPIVRSAVDFLNHMASFTSAGVSNSPS